MFINNFDPVAFQLFSLEIRWYSLAYIIGILLGWLHCKKILRNNTRLFRLFDDLITYLIIGIILSIASGSKSKVSFGNLLNLFDIFIP